MRYVYPFLLCFVTLAVALYQFLTLQYAGFPDGHLTDYDRYAVPLHTAFAFLSVAFSLYFGIGGAIAIKKRAHTRIIMAMIFYALICTVIFGVDYYLWSNFEHGQGI